MTITTEPLQKALASLNVALDRSRQAKQDLELRDACIQRFEYTFELSIKVIKRYLEQEMPILLIDQINYRELLRSAFEAGLIQQVEAWFLYREARNQTSHAYDEKKAQFVYDVIFSFVEQAKFLLTQLSDRLEKK